MIDLLKLLKIRYLILFIVLLLSALIITNLTYNRQQDVFVSEIVIKPIPEYDNIFSNYSLFNEIKFNRSQLSSEELITLVTNEFRNSEFTTKILNDSGMENNIIGDPNITYLRNNPAEGVPVGSISLSVTSRSSNGVSDYLIKLVNNAESISRNKIYDNFSIFLETNENLKNDELRKIQLSIKKIITLFKNEILDIKNEIILSNNLGFVEPVISKDFAASKNNYLSGSVVLEKRLADMITAKENIEKLLVDLEIKPVEQAVYQIVHEFVRYLDEHPTFARVVGNSLTRDLISFKVYEYIENSANIKQAIQILKRSDFNLVLYNNTQINTRNLKKSGTSYYIFAIILSIFLTLLIITVSELYFQRRLPNIK